MEYKKIFQILGTVHHTTKKKLSFLDPYEVLGLIGLMYVYVIMKNDFFFVYIFRSIALTTNDDLRRKYKVFFVPFREEMFFGIKFERKKSITQVVVSVC